MHPSLPLNPPRFTLYCLQVVVGDVHDSWGERDAACLQLLQPSMVLFVGDFGNEVVQLVAEVRAVPHARGG